MQFGELVKTLAAVESTTQRTTMVKLLTSLLKRARPDEVDKIVYFVLGDLKPPWEGVELGVAEKLCLRAVSKAAGTPLSELEAVYKRTGDVGEAARRALSAAKRPGLLAFGQQKPLEVSEVYDTLLKVAKAAGEGAQDMKISLLASLFARATPEEAKYIARFVVGKLRLGVADMTLLEALSEAFGVGKEALERAYHVWPDMGKLARHVAEGRPLEEVKITPGVPVLPMLAQRLSSASEILAKLGGAAVCEYKYDGERAQIHISGGSVKIFSRRLEDITHAYPDVVKAVKESVAAGEAILEGEIVAVDPDTGDMLPFQELMHRKRKHEVAAAVESYPAVLNLFDVLYLDGEDLTGEPLIYRRLRLSEVVHETEKVSIARWRLFDDPGEVDVFFHEAVSLGMEGLVCKSPTSIYEMGARGWNWIKYKRDYKSEMIDTVDLVVVGAFYGRGKRAGLYGAFLLAAYDPQTDMFYTVCKVGSGFTDADLKKMYEVLQPYKIPHRHPRVVSKMTPDVWFTPQVVIEVIGAEITLSPLHTCCLGAVRPGVGLAIRFPRFTGRYRTDKSPEQATTPAEMVELYKRQKKVAQPE
ncbi:ATP-dependent DNA ligase [Pyrobaculum neutrophilum]|uniref:DNA ligase n=1 Tax=Pyrobaculum neutrophilum (strain DSM 2338 / JCM 9278 / NBRC 100436 / V24Sta) TaxID=444157 RepID=DNLI_PYRNV|nr:ATP-dependent DNA ligase [Pyrobaculum neutrophilum]B1YA52.1 RecName: Full=DNA ligase; AltName: Full=Polydeoxyribonucleotide synthase [ATP] [Pyrobaculum neutrophilum V24Sta]ACB39026.1 DNA ligase I, ATP-dependent Dnl1 [Pyrobaculum neutrophilum V24Sta]